jgi:hypothetical protein
VIEFSYKDRKYLLILPAKPLRKSSLIWEVLNRGGVFAVDIESSVFTIIPGTAQVEFQEVKVVKK